jgi:IPT/TIG domain
MFHIELTAIVSGGVGVLGSLVTGTVQSLYRRHFQEHKVSRPRITLDIGSGKTIPIDEANPEVIRVALAVLAENEQHKGSAGGHSHDDTAPVVTAVSPTSGGAGGGTMVTVTGAGFTRATSVRFGTNSAAMTVVSDTRISATSPAGSGTVDVTVVTPAGSSTTSPADQFTYYS